ncbi:bile acid:sodium symporter family protein [Parabacteroides sp. FAFU027]|uniref:bile acid:sodium symporter family protein n=1 Tax=Parabacteroides sp. FAFU027 TaxID=2922715 RepID=UPI0021D43900|nr:transporter [Parabacteroides sp. FAFU027]
MILRLIKSYMLPIAMTTGILFASFFAQFAPITPYLIFVMLFVTYCKVSIREIAFERFHYYLAAIQLFGSLLVYGIVYLYNPVVAQGSMICVLAPTATAAAVITGMLGGNVASLTAYSFISNLVVALFAPAIFSLIGSRGDISFLSSLFHILKEVFPMLMLPIITAVALQKTAPRIHHYIQNRQSISFYLWALALTIMVGKTVMFIKHQSTSKYDAEIAIAVIAFLVCIAQFYIGRKIGSRYKNTITAGQGLFQKNTVLAIWMAQSYLDPLSSIGPGAYILWQNSVNSYQLWLKQRKK